MVRPPVANFTQSARYPYVSGLTTCFRVGNIRLSCQHGNKPPSSNTGVIPERRAKAMSKLPFVFLPANEQARARAMFFDARPYDGYLYELDCDGRVLCRTKADY